MFIIHFHGLHHFSKYMKQAEAEVVPSSSLVEVEVGVGGVRVGLGLTFPVGWVGGWRFGE